MVACIECEKRLKWDRFTPTCPLCGCLRPDEAVRCDICGHDGCAGCVKNGRCDLCFDIEKERNG